VDADLPAFFIQGKTTNFYRFSFQILSPLTYHIMSENVSAEPRPSSGDVLRTTQPADGSLQAEGSGLSTDETTPKADAELEFDQPDAKGWKFWMIFPPLCIATLLMALESTVTSTSLPMIAAALNSGDNYVWFLNGYLLTS
jgi:hypothetical protein